MFASALAAALTALAALTVVVSRARAQNVSMTSLLAAGRGTIAPARRTEGRTFIRARRCPHEGSFTLLERGVGRDRPG